MVYIRLRKAKQKQIGGIDGHSANVFRWSDYIRVCRRKNVVVGMKTILVSHIPLQNLLDRVKPRIVRENENFGVYKLDNALILTEWDNNVKKWKYTRQNNQ